MAFKMKSGSPFQRNFKLALQKGTTEALSEASTEIAKNLIEKKKLVEKVKNYPGVSRMTK